MSIVYPMFMSSGTPTQMTSGHVRGVVFLTVSGVTATGSLGLALPAGWRVADVLVANVGTASLTSYNFYITATSPLYTVIIGRIYAPNDGVYRVITTVPSNASPEVVSLVDRTMALAGSVATGISLKLIICIEPAFLDYAAKALKLASVGLAETGLDEDMPAYTDLVSSEGYSSSVALDITIPARHYIAALFVRNSGSAPLSQNNSPPYMLRLGSAEGPGMFSWYASVANDGLWHGVGLYYATGGDSTYTRNIAAASGLLYLTGGFDAGVSLQFMARLLEVPDGIG